MGAPDLGFLELGPSMSEWMLAPLALVPSVIKAGGSLPRHLPWHCHCLFLSSTSEAMALNLTQLKTEGHGLSHLVHQVVRAHPCDNSRVGVPAAVGKSASACGHCPPAWMCLLTRPIKSLPPDPRSAQGGCSSKSGTPHPLTT